MNKRYYEHTLPIIRGSLSNTYVVNYQFDFIHIAVNFTLFFSFPPFGSFLCLNRFEVLRMRYTAVGTASYDGFSCQLLFRRKEEFAGNTLQAAVSSATADLCI